MNIKGMLRRVWHTKDVVVTLDDVLPMYGEGNTRDEAINDLIASLWSLRAMLEEDEANLGGPLIVELAFLRRLMDPPPATTIRITTGPVWTTNTGANA